MALSCDKLSLARMVVIASIVIFGLVLAQTDQSSSTESTPLKDHLCKKVATGHFGRIKLKSITYKMYDKLAIFESTKKYIIETSLIKLTGLPLDFNGFDWNADELRPGVEALVKAGKRVDINSIIAVYMMYSGARWWRRVQGAPSYEVSFFDFTNWHWDRVKLAALLYTNTDVYSMDIHKKDAPKLYYDHQNNHPEFAIVHDQVKGEKARGYVINKDIYSNTGDLIIYDLEVYFGSFKTNVHRLSKVNNDERAAAPFYYLEKGSTASELLLVHRSRRKGMRGDPKAQLFHSVPRGFRLGGHVYLFDSNVGCVYVITNMTIRLSEEFYNSQRDLVFTRRGIPYEKFFECKDAQFARPYPHDPNRCDVTREVEPYAAPLNVTSAPIMEDDPTSIWVLLGVLLFALLLLALGSVVYLFYGQSMNDESFFLGRDTKRKLSKSATTKILDRLAHKKSANFRPPPMVASVSGHSFSSKKSPVSETKSMPGHSKANESDKSISSKTTSIIANSDDK